MTLAPVLRAAHVRQSPADAFRLFTDHIGAWWPLATHGLFGAAAGGLAFQDGCLVERSVTGATTTWGEVLVWDPPHRLSISWHPGRDGGGEASRVEVVFTADDDGTRVVLTHTGWESFGDRAAAARGGYVGPNAWGAVLDHFCDVADRPGVADDAVADLRRAYTALFDEAQRDGFSSPSDGGWTAEQVVAHVALNDDLMATACRALIEQRPALFDNTPGHDPVLLDAYVGGHPDMGALVAAGRDRAETLCLLLARLDDDQRTTEVHCHLIDAGNVVVDQPMPWGVVALQIQPGRHLAAHTEQLRDLRAARSGA